MPVKYLALLEELLPEVLLVAVSIPTFREQRHPAVCAKVRRGLVLQSWPCIIRACWIEDWRLFPTRGVADCLQRLQCRFLLSFVTPLVLVSLTFWTADVELDHLNTQIELMYECSQMCRPPINIDNVLQYCPELIEALLCAT